MLLGTQKFIPVACAANRGWGHELGWLYVRLHARRASLICREAQPQVRIAPASQPRSTTCLRSCVTAPLGAFPNCRVEVIVSWSPTATGYRACSGMDVQLETAQQLLQLLRTPSHAVAASGVYVHPGVCVARDSYGGLGLFVRRPHEVDTLLANHMEALGQRRWIGIAPDELLFSIPRNLCLEPPTLPPAAAHIGLEEASEGVAPAHAAIARRLAALCRVPPDMTTPASTTTRTTSASDSDQLLNTYLASLPDVASLAQVLPALWVVLPPDLTCSDEGRPMGTSASAAAAVAARVRLMLCLLAPSPSATNAIQEQLAVLQPHLPPAVRDALQAQQAANGQASDVAAAAGQGGQLMPASAGHQQEQHVRPVSQAGDQQHGGQPGTAAWAHGIVWSRAIHLWGGPTLVPLADFLNHSFPPNVVCTARTEDPPKGSAGEGEGEMPSSTGPPRQLFECHAVRPLAPSMELHWVYNSHSHDAGWLFSYGFVPSDGRSSHPAPVTPGITASSAGVEEEQAQIRQAVSNGFSAAQEACSEAAHLLPAGLHQALYALLTREHTAAVPLLAAAAAEREVGTPVDLSTTESDGD